MFDRPPEEEVPRENPHLIRVFTIPPPGGQYIGPSGRDVIFTEVDWFRDSMELDGVLAQEMGVYPREDYSITTLQGQEHLAKFIKDKVYYNPEYPYLVVSPRAAFTINYTAT